MFDGCAAIAQFTIDRVHQLSTIASYLYTSTHTTNASMSDASASWLSTEAALSWYTGIS